GWRAADACRAGHPRQGSELASEPIEHNAREQVHRAQRGGSVSGRAVTGRTDEVVIVGAGLGGLAAALRLAAAGRRVTVCEREPVPGGRAGVLADSGYLFDTGPTVLTMPELIADTLACVGERLEGWLT